VILAAAVATTFMRASRFEKLTPLRPDDVTLTAPSNTFVLTASDATTVEAPMCARQIPGGSAAVLVLPDQGGGNNTNGCACFTVHPSSPGPYFAWTRVRWNDSCGNSLVLAVEGSPDFVVGQDDVYNTWHWIKAGQYTLEQPQHEVLLKGREDGIAAEAILFTPDKDFVPRGGVVRPGREFGRCRFEDRFDRSPGHGLGPWRPVSGKWEIEFTLDPNRIPNQYSLMGTPAQTNGEAMAIADGTDWGGCRLAFSASALRDGRFGALLDCSSNGSAGLRVVIEVADGHSRLIVDGPRPPLTGDLGDAVRVGQWHRFVIERWAWMLRVSIDDREVLQRSALSPAAGFLGLHVTEGTVAFDDVSALEIPWQAEDGKEHRISWQVTEKDRWYRPRRAGTQEALRGRRGRIATQYHNLPVREVFVDDGPDTACVVHCRGLQEQRLADGTRWLRASAAAASPRLSLEVARRSRSVRLRRLAVCYGQHPPEVYHDGPYHFTEAMTVDPSDYLDFTPEEYRRIAKSPEADKLIRQPRQFRLVGRGSKAAWRTKGGTWTIHDGLLEVRGPNAVGRFWQDINSGFELGMRFSLGPGARVEVVLHEEAGSGRRVKLCAGSQSRAGTPGVVELATEGHDDWHRLRVRVTERAIQARIDEGPWRQASCTQGHGGGVLLKVTAGSAKFDDIEFSVPRRQPKARLYVFDRREPDWWREGGVWMDHGGMVCVLTSNWIGLTAPDGEGTIWNKHRFAPNLLVGFNIEESSEWFGWQKKPSHMHHPCDNVRVLLVTADGKDDGYRLEVNSRKRTRTVLYRKGIEVAGVPQDARFPIRYRGGHAPYSPRRSRVTLVKSGAVLRAIVNNKEVLRYEDAEPLPVCRVGLGGYDTHINFSHIEICELHED